jgi:hypothetical protein
MTWATVISDFTFPKIMIKKLDISFEKAAVQADR